VDPRLQRRALAHVVGVAHHGGAGLGGDPAGVVQAAVVHADHQRVAGAQVADHLADDLALVEQRDHEPGVLGARGDGGTVLLGRSIGRAQGLSFGTAGSPRRRVISDGMRRGMQGRRRPMRIPCHGGPPLVVIDAHATPARCPTRRITVKTAVVALGKIGLPLAVQFADAGHEVVGVDVNARQVELINAATEPFPGEAHLQEKLSELVPAWKLRATTDYAEAIPGADEVVIVVTLFVGDETWEPDVAWMDVARHYLGEHLTPGAHVSYETTLPVGTLRGRFVPMLEEISGLKESEDFFAVFSPERVLTGRVFEDLRKYPKLIGAITEAGAQRAREFYESALTFDERPDLNKPNGVWDLGSPEASELAKLAETTYRDVNIGLANEFALFAQDNGVDVY